MFNLSNKTKAIIISVAAGVLAIIVCIAYFSSDLYTFQKAQKTYKSIDAAYEKVDAFSDDIYSAWSKGINHKDELEGIGGWYSRDYMEGLEYLAADMNISLDDIKKGVISLDNLGKIPENYTDYDVEEAYRNMISESDSTFTVCVNIIVEAYNATGQTGLIETDLEMAKARMRDMSRDHSDYVHYTALNDYLANTLAIYDFCIEPTGTFDSMSVTLLGYKTTAQKVHFSLDYIFAE